MFRLLVILIFSAILMAKYQPSQATNDQSESVQVDLENEVQENVMTRKRITCGFKKCKKSQICRKKCGPTCTPRRVKEEECLKPLTTSKSCNSNDTLCCKKDECRAIADGQETKCCSTSFGNCTKETLFCLDDFTCTPEGKVCRNSVPESECSRKDYGPYGTTVYSAPFRCCSGQCKEFGKDNYKCCDPTFSPCTPEKTQCCGNGCKDNKCCIALGPDQGAGCTDSSQCCEGICSINLANISPYGRPSKICCLDVGTKATNQTDCCSGQANQDGLCCASNGESVEKVEQCCSGKMTTQLTCCGESKTKMAECSQDSDCCNEYCELIDPGSGFCCVAPKPGSKRLSLPEQSCTKDSECCSGNCVANSDSTKPSQCGAELKAT